MKKKQSRLRSVAIRKGQVTKVAVRKGFAHNNTSFLLASVFGALALLFGSVIFTYHYITLRKDVTVIPTVAQSERTIFNILTNVSKLIDLPTDEIPQVATVSDKTKLARNSFFAKAENGDEVLIYEKNKKAILYRPEIHKIIEVTSLTVNFGEPTQTASPAASPTGL